MANYNRNGWLDTAMGQVRCRPEHKSIRAELLGHMEDKEQYYLNQGMEPREAAKAAVAAMGDPVEVGKELDKAHPVLWGKLYTAAKVVIGLLCVVLIFCAIGFLVDTPLWAVTQNHPLKIEKTDPYERGGEGTVVLDGDWKSVRADGYKLEVIQAYWSSELYGGEQNVLEVDVKVSNPRPWAATPLFVRRMIDDAGREVYFSVVTSRGGRLQTGQGVSTYIQTDGDVWQGFFMDFWHDDLEDYRYWGSWYFTFSVYEVELGDSVALRHPDREELTLVFEVEVPE